MVALRWILGMVTLGHMSVASAVFPATIEFCTTEECYEYFVHSGPIPFGPYPTPEAACIAFTAFPNLQYVGVTRPSAPEEMQCRYIDPNGIQSTRTIRPGRSIPKKICPGNSVNPAGTALCVCNPGYLESVQNRTCQLPTSLELLKLKSLGSPADENCSNPVNGATGNKYQSEIDYSEPNSPLRFERYYNSDFSHSRMLGQGWRHTYDSELNATGTTIGSTALVIRPDGRAYTFTRTATEWAPPPDINDRLVDALVNGKIQWQLTIGDDNSIEIFNTAGTLTSIIYPNTRRVDISYDSFGRLQYATDKLTGRRLSFTHSTATAGYRLLLTMNDPAGKTIVYGYYSPQFSERLSTVYRPDVNTRRSYFYNESMHAGASIPNALTGIQDENGVRYANYGYDAFGRGVYTEHAGGVDRHSFSYNPDGSTTVIDPLGAARTYTYTTVQGVRRQIGQSQPAGAGCPASASARTYDANGNIASLTDFNGNVTTHSWDPSRNLLTKKVEASGTLEARTTSTEWHASWRLPTRVAEPKRRITYVYNGDSHQGSPISCAPLGASIPAGTGTRPAPLLCREIHEATTDASGAAGFSANVTGQPRTWTYSYNESGQVLTEDGPRTDVTDTTTYAYYTTTGSDHAIGDLQSITNAQGHTTHFDRYDENGRLLEARDPNSVTLSYRWHPRGWLMSTSVDGLTTVYERDGVGQLLSVTSTDGKKLDYAYDAAQRLVRVSDMAGRSVILNRDNLGNITQTEWVDPGNVLARRIFSSFDVLGREQSRAETHNGISQVTQYSYDTNGNRTSVTDAKAQTINATYDAFNRVSKVTGAYSTRLWLRYDARDQLLVFNPFRNVSSFTVDGLGNVTQEISPLRDVRTAAFDAAGNLLNQTDSRGIIQSRSYDALNRLTGISYPNAGEDVTLTWDTGPGCTNGIGRLCAVTDSIGSSRWAYDSRGNTLSRTRIVAGVTYTTRYTHDTADRESSLEAPTGLMVTIGRDSDGHIEQLSADVEGQSQLKLADQVQLNAAGNTIGLLMGNGVSLARTYAEDARLLEQQATPPLANLALSYDANGNILTRSLAGSTVTYSYDELDRLTGEAGPAKTQSFTYDPTHNRLSDAEGSKTYLSGSDRLRKLNGQDVVVDTRGNTLQMRGHTFTWNQAGQLAAVSLGSTLIASYFYDERGLRSRKVTTPAATQGSSTIVYHHDEVGRLMAETAVNGTPLRTYVWLNDKPQAVIVHDGTIRRALYLEVDQLGSPIAARNQAGQLVWMWASDAFGSVAPNEDPDGDGAKTTINLRFPGQYFDAESGLHYNWHRYYDPRIGRYITPDPIGFRGGSNYFDYAKQNPLRFTDPNGLTAGAYPGAIAGSAFGPVGTVVGGLVGAGASAWLGWNVVGPMLAKPPKDAEVTDGAKAPGKPGPAEGFKDPKRGENWVPNPNAKGPRFGWEAEDGGVWCPTGPAGAPGTGTSGPAHGGAHWDVQYPGGGGFNMYPGGKRRDR